MTLIEELRSEAIHCLDFNARRDLLETASQLVLALAMLYAQPTEETLRAVNCLWVHGKRLLYLVEPQEVA